MSSIEVLYSRRPLPGAALLRLFAWSSWSHCALVSGQGEAATIIEAVGFAGVRERPLAEAIAEASHWRIDRLACVDPVQAIRAARSQIGKPYDYLGVLGLGLHRDWHDDDAWWCSELVAWAIEQTGTRLFRAERVRRVTQEHLWMLAPAQP